MIYQAQGINVSPTLVTIGSMSYPVRNIAAVGVEQTAPSSCGPLTLFGFGLGLSTCGGFGAAGAPDDGAQVMLVLMLLLGLALLIPGIYFLVAGKPMYHLVFETNSGRKRAYSTKDKNQIEAIQGAIHQAIGSH